MNNDTTPIENTNPPFTQWAVLELMGHRRLCGLLMEQEIAGHNFLRIDCPIAEGGMTTQYYSPSAVYCITPTTEELVRKMASTNSPAPIHRYELPEETEPESQEESEVPFQ